MLCVTCQVSRVMCHLSHRAGAVSVKIKVNRKKYYNCIVVGLDCEIAYYLDAGYRVSIELGWSAKSWKYLEFVLYHIIILTFTSSKLSHRGVCWCSCIWLVFGRYPRATKRRHCESGECLPDLVCTAAYPLFQRGRPAPVFSQLTQY